MPQLDDAIVQATQQVSDPRTGAPVYDTWKGTGGDPEVGRLGSGSDYTAFLDHLGIPSFEAGFTRPPAAGRTTRPTTTRTTWSTTSTRATSGTRGRRGVGTAALRLANSDVLPFHYSDYAAAVGSYIAELQQIQAENAGAAQVDLSTLAEARGAGARRPRRSRPGPTTCSPPGTPTAARRAGRSPGSTPP